MDLKDYDHITIPKGLDAAIERGIDKGILYKNYEKENQRRFRWRQAVASIVVVGGMVTTIANVPVFARELVDIPIVGEMIRVLNFTGGIEKGGVIDDGLNMNINSYEEESIDLYFTRDSSAEADVPVYEFTYRQYPYVLEMKLQGVREFDIAEAKAVLEALPLVKEVYSTMILDDSSYGLKIVFKENVAVQMTEYKNPGRLHITLKGEKVVENMTAKYFVQSGTYVNDENLAIDRESLALDDIVNIQKVNEGEFVLEMGPYETEEEARKQLQKLEEDQASHIRWHITKRQMGENPKS